MPHGLTPEDFDDLVERYNAIYEDLIEYEAVPLGEDAIADAADAISDAGDDPSEVLSALLDEREAAQEAYRDGIDVEWDHSEYDNYDLGEEWFYYH